VGFSAALRDELLALDGDTGARAILERHAGLIVQVRSDDPGIFVDIDTPQDLARLSG
jgi:molybdenum cofactor cytidylyltransferase